jgi:hypothetical protein
MARRSTDQRGACARRERSGPGAWCDPRPSRQRRQMPRGRHGPLGLGAAEPMARLPRLAASRGAVLHPARTDTRRTVRTGRRARPAAPHRPRSRGAPPVCAPSTPPRTRRRDVPPGVPLLVIQRQLGHADLGITSAYLRGIDNTEIIHAVHERPTPMIPATASLTPNAEKTEPVPKATAVRPRGKSGRTAARAVTGPQRTVAEAVARGLPELRGEPIA